MATVTSATGTTGTTTTTGSSSTTGSASSSATAKVLANYDTFLTLLTTQLRVQNPLEPMDAEKFTEQLVQFSSVEQQIQTNKNLESMLAALTSGATLNLVNYIGKTVEAGGATTKLDDTATWSLNAEADAPVTTITVRNEDGAVVHSEQVELAEGRNTYVWDGKTTTGSAAPKGNYTITVDAVSDTGAKVGVATKISGTVTAIDTSGAEPSLTINGAKVPLSEITSITG